MPRRFGVNHATYPLTTPMVSLSTSPLSIRQRVIRHAFDLAVCNLLTVVAWPVMAMTAVAIKLGSLGPILFKQRRVGEGRKLFTM